jgi:hypothetical protein
VPSTASANEASTTEQGKVQVPGERQSEPLLLAIFCTKAQEATTGTGESKEYSSRRISGATTPGWSLELKGAAKSFSIEVLNPETSFRLDQTPTITCSCPSVFAVLVTRGHEQTTTFNPSASSSMLLYQFPSPWNSCACNRPGNFD